MRFFPSIVNRTSIWMNPAEIPVCAHVTRSNGIHEDFNGIWFDDVIAIQLQNEFTGAGQIA